MSIDEAFNVFIEEYKGIECKQQFVLGPVFKNWEGTIAWANNLYGTTNSDWIVMTEGDNNVPRTTGLTATKRRKLSSKTVRIIIQPMFAIAQACLDAYNLGLYTLS